MHTIQKNLIASLKLLKNPLIILIVILDLLFIASYGAVSGFFIEKIETEALGIINTAGQTYSTIAEDLTTNPSIFSVLKQDPTIDQQMRIIALSALIAMLIIYLLYCLLQGLSWKLTSKLFKKKFSFKKFFLINILWFTLFYIIQIFDFFRLLLESFTSSFEEAIATRPIIIIIINSIILYFTFISYTLPNLKTRQTLKKTFQIGIKKAKHILPTYIIIIITFIIIDRLLFYSFNLRALWIVVGILGIIAISWSRIFVYITVSKRA